MNIKFLRSLAFVGAFVALPVATASAQTYDANGGAVVTVAVTQNAVTSIAANLGSALAGAIPKPTGPAITPGAQGPATQFFAGGNRGSSAGAKEKKMGVWVLGSYSDIDNSNVNTAFDGDIVNVVGGVDYRFTSRIIGGVAISYENTDLDTTFNAGTFEGSGVGVVPYAAFVLNKNISADVNVGYFDLDTDTTRGAVTGSYSGDRFIAGANLNFSTAIKRWSLGGNLGFTYIKQEDDGFTESDGTVAVANEVSIGQGNVGARVGYNFGKVQPYVAVRFENEFWAPSDATINGNLVATDTTGLVITGGVDFTLSDKVTGGLSFKSSEERDDLELYTISGRIRVAF